MANVVGGDGIRVHVEGLNELIRGLKAAGPGLVRELSKAHRRMASVVANKAKGATDGRKKKAIKAKGTQTNASVEIGGQPPDALARFLGTKRRTGWYAAAKYNLSTGQQFPTWVGDRWELGDPSGSPHEIGPAINTAVESAEELYEEEIDRVFILAFPIKTG